MIIGTFLALILNFSTVGHGGRMGGGVRLILAYEAHGFTSILEKRHIFKATWGAFMGAFLLRGGVKMEERMEGDFWPTWGGIGEGVQFAYNPFLS